jgi:type VI secretion system secreted protein Hcp
MALNAYLTLKGQKQGDIKGSVTQKGREGSIMVIACSHSIISPRDAASGLSTGKRMHKPLVITKELDMASPLLLNALVNNENIPTWKLMFWTTQYVDRTSAQGLEMNHYNIELVNASICAYDFRMANNKHPELMKFNEYEEIAFVYQKITWTWVKGGVSAQDDWETPNA